jgi:hypothetical protein
VSAPTHLFQPSYGVVKQTIEIASFSMNGKYRAPSSSSSPSSPPPPYFFLILFFLEQTAQRGSGSLILDVSRSHTETEHSR